MISRKALPRRAILRGMGVSIGLPFLDAMAPALSWGAAKKPPVRLVFMYLPNGIDMPNWTPDYEGQLTTLPRILKPLEPFRDDLMMLGNLTHNYGRGLLDGAGDHGRCCASYLTGAHIRKSSTELHVDGPMSMDQLIASRIGNQTPLASLEIGMEDPRQTGSCDSGYSCGYTNNLSWKSETQPLPPILNPRMLFERLFGVNAGLTPAERKRQARIRGSILDFVRDSAKQLEADLGPTDRRKLDEYLTNIRSIEQQIVRAAKDETPVHPDLPKPAGAPADFAEHFKILTDMLTIALQADLTRVCTFMITREGTSRAYREIGISDGHHPLTHHGGKAEQLAKVTQINEYHAKSFAAWVSRIATVREGDGRLLDNMMIVYGASLNDGNRHVHSDLPTLLVGRGGGTLKPGRRIVYRKETPFCNLHLSLMDRVGVEVESFGDSSDRLSGLENAYGGAVQDQRKPQDGGRGGQPPANVAPVNSGRRGGAQAPGILFDSDMGRNIDAALALAMAYSLGAKGQVIAVAVSNSSVEAAAFCDAVSRLYLGDRSPMDFGRSGLPVGLAESGPQLGAAPMLTGPLAMKKPDGSILFKHGIADIRDTADPRVLFHNALLTQKDGEAIVILAGAANNLVRTLAVKKGRDVIASKVEILVAALGAYRSGAADPRVKADIAAARQLFAEWPGPIIAAGTEVGMAFPYTGSSIEADFAWAPAHPVVEAYRAMQSQIHQVPGQAMAAVLYAANQKEGYFKLSEPGTIEVLGDGRTEFVPSVSGKHRYLIGDAAQKERVLKAYSELASTKPSPPAGRGFRPQQANQAAEPAKAGRL